jgi:hypothetical protein
MVPPTLQSRRSFFFLFGLLVISLLYWISAPSIAQSRKYPPHFSQDPAIITTNAAAIIEDRPLDRLVPLLIHFSSVLGPDWPIFLFTSQNVPMSASFKRMIDEHRISVQFLPPGTDVNGHLNMSAFLTKPWIWEQLAPAGHVLLFQSSSIVCSNSQQKVDDFLGYDFVGAPFNQLGGEGGDISSGLSLRNRSMVLDIVQSSDWQAERDHNENSRNPSIAFEDRWFYNKMKELSGVGKPAARLPSKEVSASFSVETIWHDRPLGYSRVNRWPLEKVDLVDEWCPEHRIATTDLPPPRRGSSRIKRNLQS